MHQQSCRFDIFFSQDLSREVFLRDSWQSQNCERRINLTRTQGQSYPERQDPSRVVESCREGGILKSFAESGSSLKDVSGNVLSVARAKSSLQLKRNSALRRALTMIEKDAKASHKEVKIEWLIPESKKRAVTVAGQEAFVQEYQDTEGEFLAPFQHLRL